MKKYSILREPEIYYKLELSESQRERIAAENEIFIADNN